MLLKLKMIYIAQPETCARPAFFQQFPNIPLKRRQREKLRAAHLDQIIMLRDQILDGEKKKKQCNILSMVLN